MQNVSIYNITMSCLDSENRKKQVDEESHSPENRDNFTTGD